MTQFEKYIESLKKKQDVKALKHLLCTSFNIMCDGCPLYGKECGEKDVLHEFFFEEKE